MSTQTAPQPTVDRLSWLWLLVGTVLAAFTQFQTMVPLAAWLAPIFLLRFARTQRARVGLPVLTLALYLAATFGLRGIFPVPDLFLYGLIGAVGVLSYAVDRALASRLSGLARTLVLPAGAVLLDWGFGQSPLGTSGSVAVSQYGNAALNQVTSLAGSFGLVFLIMWLAPVVNEVWESGQPQRALRGSLIPYAAVLAAVLVYGSLRVAFASPQAAATPTVRIAALAADRVMSENLHLPGIFELAAGDDALRAQAAAAAAPIVDDLFARTRATARAGAKIVVWSEGAALLPKETEAAFLTRAEALARDEGLYLQLGVVFVLRTDHFPYEENRAVLIDPSGQVVWDYVKAVPALGEAQVIAPGPGLIPTVDTPYGRLGTIICFDADFPALIQPAGRAGIDILLVPSNDWAPVALMHTRAATFRAIENGVAMVRATGNGITLIVDHLGQELASASYFATDALMVSVDVPVRGAWTLYPRLGDGPVMACAAVLVGLAGWALLRQRPASETPAPAASAAS